MQDCLDMENRVWSTVTSFNRSFQAELVTFEDFLNHFGQLQKWVSTIHDQNSYFMKMLIVESSFLHMTSSGKRMLNLNNLKIFALLMC